jgi:hypothetical protein
MKSALNECFGNERVPFVSVDEMIQLIGQIYEQYEAELVSQGVKTALKSKGDLIAELKLDSSLIINPELTEVVKKPPLNQKCPCGSKVRYKVCKCSATDHQRT